MSLSSLRALYEKLTHFSQSSTKRRPVRRFGWNTENLEQRALLSAVMGHGTDAAVATDVAVDPRKQTANYPNLDGTWGLAGANGTTFTGTVVFQQSSSDSLTGTISVAGSGDTTLDAHRKGNAVTLDVHPATGENTHVKGRFNASHDQITVRSVVANPGGGKTNLTTVIAFDSNSAPHHFTVTVKNKKTVVATVDATRQVILT
jgi:hypothetical protein